MNQVPTYTTPFSKRHCVQWNTMVKPQQDAEKTWLCFIASNGNISL